MTVDTFFERGEFEQRVHVDLPGLSYFPFDGNRPWTRLELSSQFRRSALVGRELVIVVVGCDVLIGRLFFGGAVLTLRELKLFVGLCRLAWRKEFERLVTDSGCAGHCGSGDESAAIRIEPFRRYF